MTTGICNEVFKNISDACAESGEEKPYKNRKCTLIKGTVCGIRMETIENPLMRNIRYLDKLIDELAKGKAEN